jgi:hypothetical protein
VSRTSTQAEHTIPTEEAETFQFGPDVSGLILDSPQSMDEPSTSHFTSIVDAQPLKPTIPEPEWQMMPGPPAAEAAAPPPTSSSSASSIATTTRRSASSSASSAHTHVTRPSVDIDESDSALKAAVEISIARQISISRQQRSLLLRPLKTDVAQMPPAPAPTGGRARAATMAATASPPIKKVALSRKEGRVVETRTGTPTEIVDSHPAAHRKSERVVLDGL